MDRGLFEDRFHRAAAHARDFARGFIEETLPDPMVFRVHLNSSYDAHATVDFKLFPDDSSEQRTLQAKGVSAEEVVDLLWRDGWVPQWIDLMVVGETGDATILDVVACGRFIDDEERLYYTWTDVAPFGPTGPVLPARYVEGQSFSIYERSSCWSLADLERAERNAAKVWSLELHGPVFDDAVLGTRLHFPKLEILELFGCSTRGSGFGGLAGLPRLRHLRATFATTGSLALGTIPRMANLRSLSLRFLPPALEDVGRLADLPALEELALASAFQTRSDEDLVLSKLERLTLEFPNIPPWIRMPQHLRWLALHAPLASDDDLRRLLSECPETLDQLGLRGTPVSDDILAALDRFAGLRYLDAVDTNIERKALRRFARARPGIKCLPALDAVPTIRFARGEGSIFDADVEALVNPVNCAGVMGKGLALQFKTAFPEVFREYKGACRAGELRPGRVHVVAREDAGPKFIINFPTKNHWRDRSKIDDIVSGLEHLVAQVVELTIRSIAIPALGCGLGGLDWQGVEPLIKHAFAVSKVRQNLLVILFAPG